MSRNVPAALETEIASNQNAPIEIYEIYLEDQTYYYANAEQDITFASQTYTALGIGRTRIRTSMASKVDELTVQLDNVDNGFSQLIQTKNLQGQRVVVRKIFRDYLSDITYMVILFDGKMDSISVTPSAAAIRIVSWLDAVTKKYPGRVFQQQCGYKFGDSWCGINRDSVNNKVSGAALVGTTLTLEDSALTQIADYWKNGILKITGGTNSGQSRQVKSFTSTVQVTEDPWAQIADYGDTTNVFSLFEYDGMIYAGVDNGKVLRSSSGDSGSWTEVFDAGAIVVYTFSSFDNYIYAAVGGTGAVAKVYRSATGDTGTWAEVFDPGAERALCLISFDSYIYVGVGENIDGDGKVYRSASGDTGSWSEVLDTNDRRVTCLGVHDGKIFAGTFIDGAIWRSSSGNSGTWAKVYDIGFNSLMGALASYGSNVYAGTGYTDGKILRSSSGDLGSWTEVFDTGEARVPSMIEYDDYIYVGSGLSGGKVYRSASGDTGSWSEVLNPTADGIWAMVVFNYYLYVGCWDAANAGELYRYRSDQITSNGTVTVRMPFSSTIDNTSQYTLYRGCNKTRDDCINRYNNWVRYGGFTTIPRKPYT